MVCYDYEGVCGDTSELDFAWYHMSALIPVIPGERGEDWWEWIRMAIHKMNLSFIHSVFGPQMCQKKHIRIWLCLVPNTRYHIDNFRRKVRELVAEVASQALLGDKYKNDPGP